MEVEVTQEYTGSSGTLSTLPHVEAGPRLRPPRRRPATPVKEIIAGKSYHRPLGGMIAVAGVGRDAWLASPLALVNLYSFAPAWNPNLSPEEIAAEWTRQTISSDPDVVATVVKMLMQSWPTYEDYTARSACRPSRHHRQPLRPNIESSENNGWAMAPRRSRCVGMDRSVATGTGFAGQYPPEVAKLYEDPPLPRRTPAFLPPRAVHVQTALRQDRHPAHLRQPL